MIKEKLTLMYCLVDSFWRLVFLTKSCKNKNPRFLVFSSDSVTHRENSKFDMRNFNFRYYNLKFPVKNFALVIV